MSSNLVIGVNVVFVEKGVYVVTRDCVVDNGGDNYDTEIGRISHCGIVSWIVYNGMWVHGCIHACHDDACNSAPVLTSLTPLMTSFIFFVFSLSQ